MSKYLFIIFHKGDEDDDDLDICWIRSPNTNDDVPIRKETIVRIFWVMAGISTIGIFVSVRELSANTYEVNRLDMTNWISKKTITEPEVNWDPTTWGNLWLFCRFRTVSFTPKCEIDILCRIYHQSFLRLLVLGLFQYGFLHFAHGIGGLFLSNFCEIQIWTHFANRNPYHRLLSDVIVSSPILPSHEMDPCTHN